MSAIDFYIRVVRALDEIQAPYMIVGAFAGYAYGLSRVTFDVDILLDLRPQDADEISARFPLPRYYADPEMIRNSMRMGIMFNLIDTQEGLANGSRDTVALARTGRASEARCRKNQAGLDKARMSRKKSAANITSMMEF